MVSTKPTLALVGATGAVGQVLLSMLSTREDLWGEIRLVASDRSEGHEVSARGEGQYVQELCSDVFVDVDVAILAVPAEVAAKWAPVAAEHGAVVIDGSGRAAADGHAPLVVPEINPNAARGVPTGTVLASPSAPTLMAVNVLASLHHHWHLTEVVISTYQAVSDAGVAGVWQLYEEVVELSGNRSVGQTPGDVRRLLSELDETSPFPAPIAFNVVPWVGPPSSGSPWSTAEATVRRELRRLLNLPYLRVATTCVQVPVITTHSMTVHATFEQAFTRDDAAQVLTEDSNSVVVLDEPRHAEWPTPADTVGADPTFVGRIRQSEDFPRSVDMFICSDNLRKGSGLNLLQIAELAIQD
ncbi:aspartate-semialdehyde dehydrogenase [Leekyejoonella antrihumi]|uniref:Aspartate-semialdehyde dehydrogenase n=1 Tax=Leekyejoonella antrihumi TaxID=1660198 RepID=A0A563DUM2_9MICO|nr:aspartate-semialdehyde dehydrogenase [Leekyejoonella antrihumi]TWP33960.1 aspartate-semialdehyde dehydrogenase [Leekyejoonella antrihumi]